MNYTIIDKETWPRREFFEHYTSAVPCTYSITLKLDITNILDKGLRFYPTILYLLTQTVNEHEQFRMAFRENGELVMYSNMEPCYTIFHKETETFSNIWSSYSPDYNVFLNNYDEDMRKYGSIETFSAKPDTPENSFTVSMLPWATFEGFNLNITNFNYLIPIFTMGKYYQDNSRFYMPIAIQVHHGVCDGFHVCSFINNLQQKIYKL